MCIIVEKMEGVKITKEWHEEWWVNNSDGMGLVFWEAGKPCVFRTLDKQAAYDFLCKLDGKAIIHYRYATHGNVSLDMAHPFEIIKGVYFIHNGIVDAPHDTDASLSDTARLVRHVLRPMLDNAINPVEFVRSASFRFLLEKLLGTSNRAVICDEVGYVVYNERLWHVLDGRAKSLSGTRVSNTYAWDYPSTEKVGSGPKGNPAAASASVFSQWDDVGYRASKTAVGTPTKGYDKVWDSVQWDDLDVTPVGASVKGVDIAPTSADDLYSLRYDELVDCLMDYPVESADIVYDLLAMKQITL